MSRITTTIAILTAALTLTLGGVGCGSDDPVAATVPVASPRAELLEAKRLEPTPSVVVEPELELALDARFEAPAAHVPAPVAAPAVVAPVVRLKVLRGGVGTGIAQRELEDARVDFDRWDEAVFAHVTVQNLESPTTIKMVWRRDGELSSVVTLPVGVSPRWRTWSKKSLRGWDVGSWQVDVYDANDQLQQTLNFDVHEGHPSEDEGC